MYPSAKLLGSAAAMILCLSGAAAAEDEGVSLLKTIDVGGKGLAAFDISYVDPLLELYAFADRTNASVDLIDSSSLTFIGRITGFKGVVIDPATGKANNDLSGPDGVQIVAHKEIWAGDGDSTVKVIDIKSQQITATISTGGKKRVDEIAWDALDHILATANNADDPPFITLFDTDHKTVLGKIIFDGTNGTPNATNGVEQPGWSPLTGLFYVSVPQIGGTATTGLENGGIAVIDPKAVTVTQVFPVTNCSPAGLTVGPRNRALIGCSGIFNGVAQSVVIDLIDGSVENFPQVGGSDQVWFDRGSRHYYLAARNNPASQGGPSLGVIDADTLDFDVNQPTDASAHSVAADAVNQLIFVPRGANNPAASPPVVNTDCPQGCVAVYKINRPSNTEEIAQEEQQ